MRGADSFVSASPHLPSPFSVLLRNHCGCYSPRKLLFAPPQLTNSLHHLTFQHSLCRSLPPPVTMATVMMKIKDIEDEVRIHRFSFQAFRLDCFHSLLARVSVAPGWKIMVLGHWLITMASAVMEERCGSWFRLNRAVS